jgi:hypothetical protein
MQRCCYAAYLSAVTAIVVNQSDLMLSVLSLLAAARKDSHIMLCASVLTTRYFVTACCTAATFRYKT